MNPLIRLALLAYPRSFRRDYGTEWTRAVDDLRVHRGLSAARIAWRIVIDVVQTAPRMRWENLMGTTRTLLTVVAVIVGGFGLMLGSPAVAVPVIAVAAILVLQGRRRDRPIAAEINAWSTRWYLWIVAGAGLFAVGFLALLTNEDNELASWAWATWILSWLSGGIVVVIGFGLAANHLYRHRHADVAG